MKNINVPHDELRKYRLGSVVVNRAMGHNFSDRYGHIVGFSRNASGELLLIVEWETEAPHVDRENSLMRGTRSAIYTGNVEVLHD